METIRILIVDDHQVVRQGIRSLLDLEPDLSVIAEASSGEEALKLVRSHKPDIVLLDLRMADMSGVEVCRRIVTKHPHSAILILTAISDDQEIFECIKAGAKGYVLKDVDVVELIRHIRIVHRGEAVLDPKVTDIVMQHMRQSAVKPEPEETTLSSKEVDIVQLIAAGLTNKEIGQALFLSPNTVKFHISNIMRKLDVNRRTEVVHKATSHDLIQPFE